MDVGTVVDMEVEALGVGSEGLTSAPVTTPRTCFSLSAPLIHMFQIGKFDSPSSMGMWIVDFGQSFCDECRWLCGGFGSVLSDEMRFPNRYK